MEDRDRCWSFNKNGQRCELIAGHDDNHAVAVAWSDEEAWTPGMQPLPTVRKTPERPFPTEADMDGFCICDHQRALHTNGVGECAACDCKGYIG